LLMRERVQEQSKVEDDGESERSSNHEPIRTRLRKSTLKKTQRTIEDDDDFQPRKPKSTKKKTAKC